VQHYCSDCSLQPAAHTCSPLADYSTLKMEAIRSSETSVVPSSTQRHIPEDNILRENCCFLYRRLGCYSKYHVTSNKAPHSKSNPAHSLWWEEFLNTPSSTFTDLSCFIETTLFWPPTGRLSLLTSLNPPPCLKFVFCAFKVTIGLVRNYVAFAIIYGPLNAHVCL
jgi:hypothetical protein